MTRKKFVIVAKTSITISEAASGRTFIELIFSLITNKFTRFQNRKKKFLEN